MVPNNPVPGSGRPHRCDPVIRHRGVKDRLSRRRFDQADGLADSMVMLPGMGCCPEPQTYLGPVALPLIVSRERPPSPSGINLHEIRSCSRNALCPACRVRGRGMPRRRPLVGTTWAAESTAGECCNQRPISAKWHWPFRGRRQAAVLSESAARTGPKSNREGFDAMGQSL